LPSLTRLLAAGDEHLARWEKFAELYTIPEEKTKSGRQTRPDARVGACG